jgi:hypothetical protein
MRDGDAPMKSKICEGENRRNGRRPHFFLGVLYYTRAVRLQFNKSKLISCSKTLKCHGKTSRYITNGCQILIGRRCCAHQYLSIQGITKLYSNSLLCRGNHDNTLDLRLIDLRLIDLCISGEVWVNNVRIVGLTKVKNGVIYAVEDYLFTEHLTEHLKSINSPRRDEESEVGSTIIEIIV